MHTLPELPYGYGGLEPYIDAQTMEIHHSKHHKTYVDKLNAALEKHPELGDKSVEELLIMLDQIPEDIRMAVRNNAGGHLNHSFFWTVMRKNFPTGGDGGEPTGDLAALITASFGDFAKFKEQFSNSAAGFFGSGWVWLTLDSKGKMNIMGTKDHINPIMEKQVTLLTLDVWEHAYYLKYQNRRPEYIDNWWYVINWEEVSKNFAAAKK